MLIRYGYEITITCPQPTPLVCLLAVHEERKADIRVPETVFTMPEVADDHLSRPVRQSLPPAGRAGRRPDAVGRRNDRG